MTGQKGKKTSKKKATAKKKGSSKKKGPGGRPTQYKPEFCEMLIKHMSQGFSFYSFGADAGCCAKTLDNWVNTYPEFLRAKGEGELLSLKWHEELARGMMTGTLRRVKKETELPNGHVVREYAPTRGDSKVYSVAMRSRFRKFGYAHRVEVTGKDGGPIKTKDLSSMTDEELDRELDQLDKALKK